MTPGCPRLEFPDISTGLRALAGALGTGAARFHLMLGDLARTEDTRPGLSLSYKDAGSPTCGSSTLS
jgi:hypothetical protein